MNLELLARAIERILSSRYGAEVKVDVRSKDTEDGTAGRSEANQTISLR